VGRREGARGGVVKLLLTADGVDPDSKGHPRSEPLSVGATEGALTVVAAATHGGRRRPDSKDDRGRTLLSYAAAAAGAGSVVELLLATGRVAPNSKDNSGRTPLYTRRGEPRTGGRATTPPRTESNPDSKDSSGGRHCSHAAEQGERQ